MSKHSRSAKPVAHPVAAGVVVVATGALVAAVLTGLAKGLSSLK